MSIFDPTSGHDPTNWLREKSLATLEAAAKLVDLANEPDTTPWYAKNLKHIAGELVSRLVPMTALFHDVAAPGVENEEWHGIIERGTFALTKWCRKWKIANPYHFSESVTARQRDESETIEKSKTMLPEIEIDAGERGREVKLDIYSHMSLQMLNDDLTGSAKRILAWMLFQLHTSEYTDIVVLNRDFLPTDIGCTIEETAEGYHLLYEKGLIEKVEGLDISDRAIALRLVLAGLNDAKHPTPFREESFGKPGLRIGGKHTAGNIFQLSFDEHLSKYLEWLARSKEKIRQLHEFLQDSIGEDVAYIENLKIAMTSDGTDSPAVIDIIARYPLDVDGRDLENQLKVLIEKWIKESRASIK